MIVNITLDQAPLHAMLNLSAVSDVRHYLNGVLIDVRADAIVVVGTDGHVLGAYRDTDYSTDAQAPLQIIIPTDLIKRIKPTRNDGLKVALTFDTESKVITLKTATVEVLGKAIEGKFPDYHRIMPLKPTGEPGQYNPHLLAKFAKFGEQARGTKNPVLVAVSHNGENGAALVNIEYVPNFVGVVMPVRLGKGKERFDPLTAPPAWALGTVKPSKAAEEFVEKLNDAITQAQTA